MLSSVLASKINFAEQEHELTVMNGDLKPMNNLLSPHDMKRLEAYTNNCVDYHMVRVSSTLFLYMLYLVVYVAFLTTCTNSHLSYTVSSNYLELGKLYIIVIV